MTTALTIDRMSFWVPGLAATVGHHRISPFKNVYLQI